MNFVRSLNKVGSWYCQCDEGYGGDDCLDLDECALNTTECDEHAYCNNTIGSYTCHCSD